MPDRPEQLDRSLFFKFIMLVNLTAKPFGRLYQRRYGITLTEWRVLLTAASHPGISAVEIADALGSEQMPISRAITGLEKHRRITRTSDPGDARRLSISLTTTGWSLYRLIAKTGRERERALLGALTDTERTELARLMEKLVTRAREIPDP